MLPFLKGFHNTIDGWRYDRDEGRRKEERATWKDVLDCYLDKVNLIEEEFDKLIASRKIKRKSLDEIMPVPRLFDDMEVLIVLMEDKETDKVPDKYEWNIEVVHGFGDT